jgi:hypothetical protein
MNAPAERFEASLAAVAVEHGLERVDVGFCNYAHNQSILVSLWWEDPRPDVHHGVIAHSTGRHDTDADAALAVALAGKARKDAQVAAFVPAELAA